MEALLKLFTGRGWPIERKDCKGNTLVFNNMQVDWVSTGGRNVLVYFKKFMWRWCGFPEWANSKVRQKWGGRDKDTMLRNDMCYCKHCALVSWKR